MEFIEEEEIRAIAARLHGLHTPVFNATKKADRRYLAGELYTLALRLENLISPQTKKYPTRSEAPVARLCARIAQIEHRYVQMMDSPYLKVVPGATVAITARLQLHYQTLRTIAGL